MRLEEIGIRDFGPLKHISAREFADVVVLAGPNGVGKTHINNAILNIARDPRPSPHHWMTLKATDDSEVHRWGKATLNTQDANDAQILRAHLQRNQKRNNYASSFLNFESDRAIRNVQPYNFSWDIGSPFQEELGWDIGMSQLSNRFNDVRHSLFRLVESQRRDIAEKALALQRTGASNLALDFPDILAPFRDAFHQLLAPKILSDVDLRHQQIYFEYNGQKLSIESLSSGEREVINIAFDFILRSPQVAGIEE